MSGTDITPSKALIIRTGLCMTDATTDNNAFPSATDIIPSVSTIPLYALYIFNASYTFHSMFPIHSIQYIYSIHFIRTGVCMTRYHNIMDFRVVPTDNIPSMMTTPFYKLYSTFLMHFIRAGLCRNYTTTANIMHFQVVPILFHLC